MPRPRPKRPIDPVKMFTWLTVALLTLMTAKALWWLLTYVYEYLKALD